MWYVRVRQRRLHSICRHICVEWNEVNHYKYKNEKWKNGEEWTAKEIRCRRVIANNGNATLSSHNFCCFLFGFASIFFFFHLPYRSMCARSLCVCQSVLMCVCVDCCEFAYLLMCEWVCMCVFTFCMPSERTKRKKNEKKKRETNHVLCSLCIQMVAQYNDNKTQSNIHYSYTLAISSLILMHFVRLLRYLFAVSIVSATLALGICLILCLCLCLSTSFIAHIHTK